MEGGKARPGIYLIDKTTQSSSQLAPRAHVPSIILTLLALPYDELFCADSYV